MAFEWTHEMQIDHGQIDDDHQKLLAIANRVLDVEHPKWDAEDLRLAIQELYDYANHHFNREEDLMRKIGYPEVETHQEKHKSIISEMSHYLTISHHMNEILNNFRKLMNDWVITHIMEEDKKIRQFMESSLWGFKPTP